MRKYTTLLFLILLAFQQSFAQQEDNSFIEWKKKGYDNKIVFSMQDLPKLQPIPGAVKKPQVKRLWLFGDGEYSFEDSPEHIYASIQAEAFEAECFLTYTYTDDEQAPEKKKRRRKKTKVPVSTSGNRARVVANVSSFNRKNRNKSSNNAVFLQTNRSPKAGEEFVAILSYRNTSNQPISGNLNLFYNEYKTCSDCFNLSEQPKSYHSEIYRSSEIGMVDVYAEALVSNNSQHFFTNAKLPSWAAKDIYKDAFAKQESWEINNLESGKEYHIFVILKTDDLKTDISLTTHVQTQFVGLNGRVIDDHEIELKLVSSHDPNNVLAANHHGRLDRKFELPWKPKDELTYKINFQNNGDGAASNIRVVLKIPQSLDTSSLEIIEAAIGGDKKMLDLAGNFSHRTYADSIVFFFKNISLGGSNQSGVKKSKSRGYIKFKIKNKKRKTKRLHTQASIYFDSKEAVVTKKSKIRLRRSKRLTLSVGSHSPRPITDWQPAEFDFSVENKFIAIGTSVLLPKKRLSLDASIVLSTEKYVLAEPTAEREYRFNHLTFNIVPQIDVLPFLRIGIGVEGGVLFSAEQNGQQDFDIFEQNQQDERYKAIRYGGLAQILIGRTKKRGLALGASYNLFYDDNPVVYPVFTDIEPPQNWHTFFRLFLRYKM